MQYTDLELELAKRIEAIKSFHVGQWVRCSEKGFSGVGEIVSINYISKPDWAMSGDQVLAFYDFNFPSIPVGNTCVVTLTVKLLYDLEYKELKPRVRDIIFTGNGEVVPYTDEMIEHYQLYLDLRREDFNRFKSVRGESVL